MFQIVQSTEHKALNRDMAPSSLSSWTCLYNLVLSKTMQISIPLAWNTSIAQLQKTSLHSDHNRFLFNLHQIAELFVKITFSFYIYFLFRIKLKVFTHTSFCQIPCFTSVWHCWKTYNDSNDLIGII